MNFLTCMSSRDLSRLLISLLVFGILLGCRAPRDATEIYGTYVAEYSFGKDKLVLTPDGNYIQELIIVGKSNIARASGRWSYEPATGYITLKNALVVTDSFGKLKATYDTPPDGDTVLPVRRFLFRGQQIGGEESVSYKKVS